MTVKELYKTIRNHRGKLEVPVLIKEDVTNIYAEKRTFSTTWRTWTKMGKHLGAFSRCMAG